MPRFLNSKQAITRDQRVSRQTVHTWMSDPRWDLGQSFPIDGEKIDAWRAATFRSTTPSMSIPGDDNYTATRRRVELQHKAEQTLYLRQRRSILENKYMERTYAERAMIGLLLDFRNRVEIWIDTLPEVFVNRTEEEIRARFNDAYDKMCEDLGALVEIPLADDQQVARFKDQSKSDAAHRRYRRF